MNIARALLFQSNTPKTFWSYDVTHVVYIRKRLTSLILDHQSPYFLLFNELHDLEALKIFKTLVYVFTLQSHITKLDYRGRKCVFLEFKQGVKGVILFDLNNNDIFLSQNLIHSKYILPYKPNWHYYTSSKSKT